MSASRRPEGQGAPLVLKPPQPRPRPPEGQEVALGWGLRPHGLLRAGRGGGDPGASPAPAMDGGGMHMARLRLHKAGARGTLRRVFPFSSCERVWGPERPDQPIAEPIQGREQLARRRTGVCASFLHTRVRASGPGARCESGHNGT